MPATSEPPRRAPSTPTSSTKESLASFPLPEKSVTADCGRGTEAMRSDLRYAFRGFAKNPAFSAAAILVLALGIGANSAIFTVIKTVLLAPLPYRDPGKLVYLYERNVVGPNAFNIVSAANFLDWQKEAQSFEQMSFYGQWGSSFSPNDGGLPEILDGAIIDHN